MRAGGQPVASSGSHPQGIGLNLPASNGHYIMAHHFKNGANFMEIFRFVFGGPDSIDSGERERV